MGQQPDTTKHVGINHHKRRNSTQNGLSTKVSCWWLIFSVSGGADHTMIWLKPVASVRYKSREIEKTKLYTGNRCGEERGRRESEEREQDQKEEKEGEGVSTRGGE